MSAWQSLNEDDFWKKVRELDLAVHSSEWDAWTPDERSFGLRLFTRPGQKICAQDLDSGAIGIGGNGGEAVAVLRSMVASNEV
jgi:hypothetical protein